MKQIETDELVEKIKYYTMPHPFKRDVDVLFTDDSDLKQNIYSIYDRYKSPSENIPLVDRVLITPAEQDFGEAEKRVIKYENKLNTNARDEIRKAKFNSFARFGTALAISYGLFYAPIGVVDLVNGMSGFIGHQSLVTYSKVAFSCIPALFSLRKHFGLGWFGRKESKMYMLNQLEAPLKEEDKLMAHFGSSTKGTILKDMDDVVNQLKTENTDEQITGKLEEMIKDLKGSEHYDLEGFGKKFDELLEECDKINLHFSRRQQLKDMAEDIMLQMAYKLRFAPLKIVSPSTKPQNIMSPYYSAYVKQSENLKAFLENPQTKKIHEKLYEDYELMKDSKASKEQKGEALKRMTRSFEALFSIVSRYDFGDSTNQNDRGNLRKFYDRFYVDIGKLSESFRKGKEKNIEKLVNELEYRTEMVLKEPVKHQRGKHFSGKTKSFFGGGLKRGLALSLGILMAYATLAGTCVIKPGEYVIRHVREPGYKGLIGERVSIVNYEDVDLKIPYYDGKVVFNLPKPLVSSHVIDRAKSYETDVFYILSEYKPQKIYPRLINMFAGDFGQGIQGLNLKVKFKVKDGWAEFDYDGRGKDRLSLLMSKMVEENLAKNMQDFQQNIYKSENKEDAKKLEKHFEKRFKDGTVSKWIVMMLYPSAYNQMRYGSTYERYAGGLEVMKGEYLDKAVEQYIEEKAKEDPNFQWSPELTKWKGFVDAQMKKIEKEVETTYGDLRADPLKIKRLVKNPEKHFQDLTNLETLFQNIRHFIISDYITSETMNQLEASVKEGKELAVTKDLLQRLQEDEFLKKLIEIEGFEVSVKSYTGTDQMNYMKKFENLI